MCQEPPPPRTFNYGGGTSYHSRWINNDEGHLGPVANTDAKLLIYGLFQKGRVLAQDGEKQIGRAYGAPRQPSTLPGLSRLNINTALSVPERIQSKRR